MGERQVKAFFVGIEGMTREFFIVLDAFILYFKTEAQRVEVVFGGLSFFLE